MGACGHAAGATRYAGTVSVSVVVAIAARRAVAAARCHAARRRAPRHHAQFRRGYRLVTQTLKTRVIRVDGRRHREVSAAIRVHVAAIILKLRLSSSCQSRKLWR